MRDITFQTHVEFKRFHARNLVAMVICPCKHIFLWTDSVKGSSGVENLMKRFAGLVSSG